ncbi:hypothetical protein NDU88_004818 [Pleurodeles waltl]|uniref:Uncharacterized protein n=1 Tax=Pleurodeles waltl TaxID=8319 RepID=A0AAV7SJW8_PLEWA|nr:hypothetical protein NDU88_004818 [Pleurodeles waltl]
MTGAWQSLPSQGSPSYGLQYVQSYCRDRNAKMLSASGHDGKRGRRSHACVPDLFFIIWHKVHLMQKSYYMAASMRTEKINCDVHLMQKSYYMAANMRTEKINCDV